MRTKIFVDAHVFDKGYQGTRTFISGIYKEMLKMPGLEIFFGARDVHKLEEEFQHPQARFIPLKSKSGWIRLSTEIPSLIKKHKIDFAHFQYMIPPVKTCRFIVTTHDVIFNDYPEYFSKIYRLGKDFLYRYAVRKADIITTVSDFSKASISRYFGIPLHNITITPNGITPAYFEDYDKEYEKACIKKKYGFDKYILYVSRVEPRKNHAHLLKAFLELELYKLGYHLVFIGSETIRSAELNRLFNQISPEVLSFMIWEQNISEMELLSFYRAAEIFVYPSLAEGFGIPPLEAAAARIPVLCSNSAALADFDFFHPYHLDPRRYEEFKEKLGALVHVPPSPNYLENISAFIQGKYNWKTSAEELYKAMTFHSGNKILQQHDQLSIT